MWDAGIATGKMRGRSVREARSGYCTTCGHANSQIAKSRTGQVADWTTHGLVNSQTGQVADLTTRGLDNSETGDVVN